MSSTRRESQAVARAVSNRRRQRANAPTTVGSDRSTATAMSSSTAYSSSITHPAINLEDILSPESATSMSVDSRATVWSERNDTSTLATTTLTRINTNGEPHIDSKTKNDISSGRTLLSGRDTSQPKQTNNNMSTQTPSPTSTLAPKSQPTPLVPSQRNSSSRGISNRIHNNLANGQPVAQQSIRQFAKHSNVNLAYNQNSASVVAATKATATIPSTMIPSTNTTTGTISTMLGAGGTASRDLVTKNLNSSTKLFQPISNNNHHSGNHEGKAKTGHTTIMTANSAVNKITTYDDDNYRHNNEQQQGYDDDDHTYEDDEDVMDVEPIQGNELIDTTCLTYGSYVCIRSSSSIPCYVAFHTMHANDETSNNDNDSSGFVSLRGMGLGKDAEIFRLGVATAANDNKHNSNNNDSYRGDQVAFEEGVVRPDNFIRYGDRITLCCPVALGKYLGVRETIFHKDGSSTVTASSSQASHHPRHYQMGFFGDDSSNHSEQWTILAACPERQRPLWIGPAAVQRRSDRHKGQAPMVRVGDSVVFRHCKTGGLLSLFVTADNNGGVCHSKNARHQSPILSLVTDSYTKQQHRPQRTSHQESQPATVSKSLLSHLQHHDRILPTEYESFQLLLPNSPPSPRWARRGLMFYSGSYLLMPERNDGIILPGSNRPTPQQLSVENQEVLLMDEVIASLMGLEGQFVRIHDPVGTPSTEVAMFQLSGDSQHLQFHLSLRRLVERILPLSTAFVQVHAFVVQHSTEWAYGSVMQALCAAMDAFLRDHVDFVNTKLDQPRRQQHYSSPTETNSPGMTMKQLFATIQPLLHTMLILQDVCVRARVKKGGSLLNDITHLRDHEYAGDGKAQLILNGLLDKAAVPYMDMLQKWLKSGMLDDPNEEFMVNCVGSNGTGQTNNVEPRYNGDSWNHLYAVRKEHILSLDILSSEAVLQKILQTGKYWNAVAAAHRLEECSLKYESSLELSFRMDSVTLLSFVDSMYQQASHSLVRLIRNECNLLETMRTMKRYFLLDQGDFFVNFLDKAEEELSKRADKVSIGQVRHWLAMTIQLCETTGDQILQVPNIKLDRVLTLPLTPHMIRCRLASESLSDHLQSLHGKTLHRVSLDSLFNNSNHQAYGAEGSRFTGVETFMLTFTDVPFPTSLVFAPTTVARYQLLFRQLFVVKHVERRLVGVWHDQQVMRVFQSLRGALGPTNLLRQRMLHFTQNLIYYIMFEVIEPNWLQMGQAIFGTEGDQTVDNITDCHNNFLGRTMDACFLTNYDFVRILTKLMNSCLRFADQMKHLAEMTKVHEEFENAAKNKRAAIARRTIGGNKKLSPTTGIDEHHRILQQQALRVSNELNQEAFQKTFTRLEHTFNKNVGEFMHLLRSDMGDLYHSHRVNLSIHLDYNGYVTRTMDIYNS